MKASNTSDTHHDASVASRDLASMLRGRIDGAALAVTFVALTFVFMILGLIAQHSGWPNWARLACFAVAYLTGGSFAVRAAYQSLREWHIDVDLLMILAAVGAAYVGNPFEGALLLFLFSLSNVLQAFAMRRTRRAIHAVMKLRPSVALTIRDGKPVKLPIEALQLGDRVLVRPGESIPLDGVIVEGASSIDESSLTGESIPVSRSVGQNVFAATTNQSGGIEIEVTRLAHDSTISRLIRLVEDAQAQKARTQRVLDTFSQWYAISVIALTLGLMFVPRMFVDEPFNATFYRAITVMVVASPCALIISTPASFLSAIGGAARRGILFKGGVNLERTATVSIVAIDKTGTLTVGKPRVTDVVTPAYAPQHAPDSAGAMDAPTLEALRLTASVEARSEHPLARAILDHARNMGIEPAACSDFQSHSGKGAVGVVDGQTIAVGNLRFFNERDLAGLDEMLAELHRLQDEGKTSVLAVAMNAELTAGRLLAVIAVADVIRPGASEVITRLRRIGMSRIVMLTGDNERVAAAMARQAGIDEVHAELMPEDKVRVIRDLEQHGRVAMVGDGVNDAPALAAATVGVAMGAAGTDVAMETADIVLMSDNLGRFPLAIEISRRARRVVYQNLSFALAVIVLLVIGALGFELPLPLGVVGHEGSTVLVVLNGLRLLSPREA